MTRCGDAILPIELGVVDGSADFASVKQARHFGSLDVIVNNGGYRRFGVAEEVSEPEIRADYEYRVATLARVAAGGRRAQGDGAWMRAMQCGAPRYRALRSGRCGL